jgi:phosphoglycolate phosphatase
MRLLIFDFDGTIADTKALYYNVIYNNVKRFGYSYEDVDKVIDLGENLRKTLKRIGLSWLLVGFMKRKIMKEVVSELKNVKKCKDVDSIKEIKTDKILVTNSLKPAVLPILNHFKLKREFKKIYGFEDFSDKAQFIKEYLKENKIKADDCYYIGDRAADVRTAREVGCKSIIIIGHCAWDSRKEIIEENPDIILSTLKDLKKLVQSKSLK